MKNTFFAGIAAFLTLVTVTCNLAPPDPQGGDPPSVQYSPDGRSITLRLDGGGTGKSVSRALTDTLARAGHNFFEVVFTHGSNIARASWEIGEPVVIRNVPRNGSDGVDYSTADGDVTGIAPALPGKAIMFVGRKQDKTLLAVGLLTGTDGGAGTVVTSDTLTVTFSVAALLAGADFDADHSAFLTEDPDETIPVVEAGQTTIEQALYLAKPFPVYRIPAGKPAVKASYTVDSTGDMEGDYLPGIFIFNYGNNEVEIPAIPRFPVGGRICENSGLAYPASTKAIITNNDGDNFENVIEIEFKTDNDANPEKNEGLCSFTFRISVCAISKAVPPGGPAPVEWFVRPGFGSNSYNLDDGTRSGGGSILLGIGGVVDGYIDDGITLPPIDLSEF